MTSIAFLKEKVKPAVLDSHDFYAREEIIH